MDNNRNNTLFITISLMGWCTLIIGTLGCPDAEPVPSVCHANCPSGWMLLEQACYIMVGEPLTWSKAEAHCAELVHDACGEGVHGHLASITSRIQGDAIYSMWRSKGRGDIGIDYLYWIGLTGTSQGTHYSEGQWTWTDQTPLSYNRWKESDDDASGSEERYEEACAYVDAQAYPEREWLAGDCSGPEGRQRGLPYVCKLVQQTTSA